MCDSGVTLSALEAPDLAFREIGRETPCESREELGHDWATKGHPLR
jgi:hypothetical protein